MVSRRFRFCLSRVVMAVLSVRYSPPSSEQMGGDGVKMGRGGES